MQFAGNDFVERPPANISNASSLSSYFPGTPENIAEHSPSPFDTKYGKRIRLDIGEKVVFLPTRFIKRIGEENMGSALSEMNKGQYWLIYRRKDSSKNNQLILDIECAKIEKN